MKNNESAEMYLENILILKQNQSKVRAIDVVRQTGYSKPSVSRAMSLLKKSGSIVIDDEGYISLTDEGFNTANKIFERHTVIADCLMALGVEKNTANDDACRIEHVISDETFTKLKEHFLKNA
ncbi:MAG: metal-dependent transcriptional regulator [Christensenellaceae bacterium]